MAYTRIYGVSVFASSGGKYPERVPVEVDDRYGEFTIKFAGRIWTAEQAQRASEVLAEAVDVLVKEQAMLAAAEQAKDVK